MGFFDKMKEAAWKGASKVENLAQTGKHKFDIVVLNSRIKYKKDLLGERAYSLFKEGIISAPQMKGIIDEIDNMLNQIKEKESEIEILGSKKTEDEIAESSAKKYECNKCGNGLEENTKYCPMCGSRILRCPNCKENLKINEAFCSSCGIKII